MRRQAIDNLRAAIEANTEKRSIEQLQAQGKRHVRVVSGEKVMKIIKAIVSDIVDREVGETTQRDRDRIVEETKQQFDRVMKMQSDQDALINEQKELVGEYRRKLEQVQETLGQTRSQLEEARAQQSAREGQMLAEFQEKIRTAADAKREAEDTAREQAHEKARIADVLENERAQRRESEERTKRDYEARIEKLHQEQRDLVARFESERGDVAGRQEQAVAIAQQRAQELEGRLTATSEAKIVLEQRAERLEADLAAARAQAEEAVERTRKAERVVSKQETRIGKAKTIIEAAKNELDRLTAEKRRLETELAELRERAGESDAVGQLRGELESVKNFLQDLGERSTGSNEATVESLLEKLSERESFNSSSLEEKFNASLDASLDKITKTMELATAKPIDYVVEATDVLVDKIFDMPDSVMSSNLDDLEVHETKSSAGIGGSLAALKAMRAGSKKKAEEKEEAAQAKALAEQASNEPAKGLNGPEAEAAVASTETRAKMSASMERLKAVRSDDKNN